MILFLARICVGNGSVYSIAALTDRACDGVSGTPCAAAVRCNANPRREQEWNSAALFAVNFATMMDSVTDMRLAVADDVHKIFKMR